MQTTKIAPEHQENALGMFWMMLRTCEQAAGTNILAKNEVEAGYRLWNLMTDSDAKPFWLG